MAEARHLDVARVRVLVVRSVAVVLMVCRLLLHPLVLLLLLVRVLGLAHHGSLVKVLLVVPGIAALCHHKPRLRLVLGRIAAVILLRVRGVCADVAYVTVVAVIIRTLLRLRLRLVLGVILLLNWLRLELMVASCHGHGVVV